MNQKMKLVAAIVAGMCAASAQAGQMAGNPTTIYAAETVTNVANVPVPTFTYQTSEPINGPVAGTNTIYVVFKASAGTWKAATGTGGAGPAAIVVPGTAPTVKLLAAASGSNPQAVSLDATLVAGPVVIGGVTYTTAADTLVYSFTIPTNAIYGLGSNIYVGSLNAAGAGGTDRIGFLTGLSASLGLGAFNDCATFSGGSVSVTTTVGNATGGQIDTIAPFAPTKTLLSSALGIAVDVTASADTSKIDAIGNASKTFTRVAGGGVPNAVNLGTIKLTTAVPGTTDLTLTPYTVASMEAAANTAQFTITGDFANQTAAAGRFFVSNLADCSTTIGAAGAIALNTALTQGSFSYPTSTFAPASAAASYVCYQPIGTVVINPAAYTVTAQLADTGTLTAFNYGKLATGGTCPAVTFTSSLNASKVIVRNYSPAAANAYGWNQYTRIINSGSVDAAVTGFYLYGDGSTGTEKQIVTSVKKGGNVTIQNSAIEALLGAPVQPAGVTTNPRLVIQSPTSSLRVQNYIVQPNGAWFETSGAQNEGGAVGVSSLQE